MNKITKTLFSKALDLLQCTFIASNLTLVLNVFALWVLSIVHSKPDIAIYSIFPVISSITSCLVFSYTHWVCLKATTLAHSTLDQHLKALTLFFSGLPALTFIGFLICFSAGFSEGPPTTLSTKGPVIIILTYSSFLLASILSAYCSTFNINLYQKLFNKLKSFFTKPSY